MRFPSVYRSLKDPAFWAKAEFNRFVLSALLITAQSCIGGVAIGYLFKYGFGGDLLLLWIISATTSAANAAVIAQPPMKWIFGTSAIAVLAAICVSIYSVIAGVSGI